jgi:endonuclease/exonuclease/phosphatase family metal-dependent hydrolase
MSKILLLILIFYCQFFWPTNTQAQGFKIVSYNVLFDDLTGIYRYPKIISFLKNTKADIICLQEVTPKFYQYILESTDIKQDYKIYPNKSPVYYGNIILSKFNIINSNIISIPTQIDLF